MMAAKAKEPGRTKAEAPGQKAKQNPASAQEPAFNPLWQQLALGMQAKLAVGAPDDPYEREADEVAERVMRMPEPPVQHKCVAGEEEQEKLQRKESGNATDDPATVHPIVQQALSAPGQPLDPATRGFFESRFWREFSEVRVHTGPQATASARALRAKAYTLGTDIVFSAGSFNAASREGQSLIAHELAHVVQQGTGAGGRRVQRQMVARPVPAMAPVSTAARTVGTGGDNIREDVLSVMDRLHWIGALADADYGTEHATVTPKTGGTKIADSDIRQTIAAITANEVDSLAPWQVEKILALRTGGEVGSGKANAAADVSLLQVRLRALGILSDADFAAERGATAIPKTLAAIKQLRISYASGTLGWQPMRLGDWKSPDESLFGGDRFGGQTFTFTATLPSFIPGTDPPGSWNNRSWPVSLFVPTQVTAPRGGGEPTATSTKVAVFFAPADATFTTSAQATNDVVTHGLRGAAEGSDWVLISLPGIHDPRSNTDGWVAITNAAITFCLDRAGLPTTLGTVRLISHSRGAEGLKRTLTTKTLTATVDKIIVLDESTTFGPGGGTAGDLGPFIKGAAPAKPGDPGITMAPGGGAVSYQVVAQPLAGTTQTPKIDPACARCIGYSRLIRDAVNENAAVARAMFGPAPATPPDWTGIWPQLLALPPRGKFTTKSPTPPRTTDNIYSFCSTNKAAIAAMDAHVMAAWPLQLKPAAALTPKDIKTLSLSPKAFCVAAGLGRTDLNPTIDAHHNFVAEIAHELFV